MPLQWSNYTHPNLYLLESHARSASLLTCLCGGLGYGTRYSWCAWLTDWPATAAILGVWGYISRVLAFLFIYLFIYLFSFRCLILAKFWCASILHTPVTTKEKWAAGSQRGPRCWAGRNGRKNKRTKAANCFIPKLIGYISSISYKDQNEDVTSFVIVFVDKQPKKKKGKKSYFCFNYWKLNLADFWC